MRNFPLRPPLLADHNFEKVVAYCETLSPHVIVQTLKSCSPSQFAIAWVLAQRYDNLCVGKKAFVVIETGKDNTDKNRIQ